LAKRIPTHAANHSNVHNSVIESWLVYIGWSERLTDLLLSGDSPLVETPKLM